MKKNRSLNPEILVSLIGLVGTIVVAYLGYLATQRVPPTIPTPSFDEPITRTPSVTKTPTITPAVTKDGSSSVSDQILGLRQDIFDLQNRLASLEAIDQRLASFEGRLNNLEDVILDDPSKAIEVVLLRNEIEQLKDEVSLMRSDISGSKSQNYLNLALIIPISVTLLGIALSIIRQLRLKSDGNQENDQEEESSN